MALQLTADEINRLLDHMQSPRGNRINPKDRTPKRIGQHQYDIAAKLLRQGYTIGSIMKITDLSRYTINRIKAGKYDFMSGGRK